VLLESQYVPRGPVIHNFTFLSGDCTNGQEHGALMSLNAPLTSAVYPSLSFVISKIVENKSNPSFYNSFLFFRALHAKHKQKLNDALKEAADARRHRDVAPQATYHMVEMYLQPVVEAIWAGDTVGGDVAMSTVETCDHLLSSMDATERNTTRWQVQLSMFNVHDLP
jgi:hypothetical protein